MNRQPPPARTGGPPDSGAIQKRLSELKESLTRIQERLVNTADPFERARLKTTRRYLLTERARLKVTLDGIAHRRREEREARQRATRSVPPNASRPPD